MDEADRTRITMALQFLRAGGVLLWPQWLAMDASTRAAFIAAGEELSRERAERPFDQFNRGMVELQLEGALARAAEAAFQDGSRG